jgi:biopolymer transport protein ExbD
MQEAYGDSIRAELSRRLGNRRGRTINLRVIPMIDVLFLLLILFILTSSFRPAESFLPFVLPKLEGAGTGAAVVEPLEIFVNATRSGCSIHVGQAGGVAVSEKEAEAGIVAFADRLAEVMKRQKRTAGDPVEIVCQDGVEWQYVVKVYDVLYGMGVGDITFRMTE